ncbi:MAG: hypothetical protein HN802_02710 [Candidatus Jacksonbacteria bacterium]|jgi:hypothetical protein|nr:hypothetical protein [Candidatus Jacksonbacteria bacterium]
MKLKDLPRKGSRLLTKAVIVSAKIATKGFIFVGKNAIKGIKEAIHETSETKKA